MKKSFGPFSGGQLTTIICVVVVMVMFPVGAWAAVAGSSTFVTDATTGKHATVDASGNLHIDAANPNAIPLKQFSLGPQPVAETPGGAAQMQPDPSGTLYAISSFTVTNPNPGTFRVQMFAIAASSFSDGCAVIGNQVKQVAGPDIVVGPDSTATLTFPQPYVFGAAGARVCLAVGGDNLIGEEWSVVGHKL
jgi:hypothetical protein